MDKITNYLDLCRKIDNVETQLFQVEIDLDYWFGKGEPSFTETNTRDFGVVASMGNIQELQDKKHRLQKMLDFYGDIKTETEGKIYQLEGLKYQIARMKYMENKSYKQIADELGKSYGYIRTVGSRQIN